MEAILKIIRKQAFFVGTTVLTLLILLYSIFIFFNWDKEPESDLQIEVSLPVLDLGSYRTLSKQYKEVKIKR